MPKGGWIMILVPNYEEKQAREDDLRKLYQDWFFNRSPEEDRLFDLIITYHEEYFEDFAFRPGSVVTPFLEYETELDGKSVTMYDEAPIETSEIYSHYRFRVEDLDDDAAEGQIDFTNRFITIPSRNLDNKGVILHEMIHAYEGILNESYWSYKEILLICLYEKLSKKVPNLDNRLVKNSQLYIGWKTALSGGRHGLLFYLKSLDLDLRCGYPLGTVCGYGRDEH